MKIVHLISGELNGGAARGAYWLHRGLLSLGIDSKVIYNGNTVSSDDSAFSVRSNPLVRLRLSASSRLAAIPLKVYTRPEKTTFNIGIDGFPIEKIAAVSEADLVHFHWINHLVPLSSIKKIGKPIVWTLRDMWPITGGCHYSMGCEKYKTGCGRCPQLGSQQSCDLSYLGVRLKKWAYVESITFVGISRWIANCASQSVLAKNHSVLTISNGIDLESFFPVDRLQARKILGLDPSKSIVLIGAGSVSDFYKGLDLFREAWINIKRDDVSLCVFGHVNRAELDSIDRSAVSFGFLNDAISQRIVYSAADVFVAPSRFEAFGKTIAESLACGVPVVCFDSTGPKDIVEHLSNGYLARPFEVEDLRVGIEWFLNRTQAEASILSKSALTRAQQLFDSREIAKKYCEVYRNIIFSRKDKISQPAT